MTQNNKAYPSNCTLLSKENNVINYSDSQLITSKMAIKYDFHLFDDVSEQYMWNLEVVEFNAVVWTWVIIF
jgi:hypothetical protein